MSFDIQRCSKEDLDALNERARAWKAQRLLEDREQSTDDAVPPLEEPPADNQLMLDLQ